MKAFLILKTALFLPGRVSDPTREVVSEIVFNTSMTGYLEVLTDPSYAGQAVVTTYPLIGNTALRWIWSRNGHGWTDILCGTGAGFPAISVVRETIQDFLRKYDIPGICGIDTRALTKILREREP